MKSEEKIRVTIDIYGKSYNVIGALSQTVVNQLCQWINEQLYMTARNSPRLDAEKVYILSLLKIAEDQMRSRDKMERSEADRQALQIRYEEVVDQLQRTEEKVRFQTKEIQLLLERMNWLEEEYAQRQTMSGGSSASLARTETEVGVIGPLTERTQTSDKEVAIPVIVSSVATESSQPTLEQQHAQLQADYAKMKQEFDEWLALLQDEEKKL